MATPIVDASVQINIPVTIGAAGSYTLPAAVKSGGAVVDFTAGSWVFALYVRPPAPPQGKSPNAWSSGVTVTGDALGIITIAWTTAATNEAGLNSSQMTAALIMSNDAGTTYQQAGSGQLRQTNVTG